MLTETEKSDLCGIAGLIGSPGKSIDLGWASNMSSALTHRGPDDRGCLTVSPGGIHLAKDLPVDSRDVRLALMHRRLSIIDLHQTGWQPMGTMDGRFYIVFNGEIYNYLELREELEGLGVTFRSSSDTEVLLEAYAIWGPAALTRLVGMFAFAVYDVAKSEVFLARDPFGIKPLYYTVGTDWLAFASEIKSLLAIPTVPRIADPDRVYAYLRFAHTDHGDGTLFRGIDQVPAAHCATVDLERPADVSLSRYWAIDMNRSLDIGAEEATKELRRLFLHSVALHMRSDVPLGSALSGGIDSSSIVMAMRHLSGAALDLHTFSFVTPEKSISEERWVDLVGQRSSATVHKVYATEDELVSDLDSLMAAQDEPFGSTGIYAQYRVFERARAEGIKVMLDGQGGDEILGGYLPYVAARLATLIRSGDWMAAWRFYRAAGRNPNIGTRWLALKCFDYLLPQALQEPMRRLVGRELAPSWINERWLRSHGVGMYSVSSTKARHVLKDRLLHDLSDASIPHLLRYEDRNSMAHSIESRVPFLTPQLSEFMFALPESCLVDDVGRPKALFRQAMRGLVPSEILDRQDKIGFATPERTWLTSLAPWIDKVLNLPEAEGVKALDIEQARREWREIVDGTRNFDPRVWRWANLILWTVRHGVTFR